MEMLPTVTDRDKDRAIALGQRLNCPLTREQIRHEAMLRRGLYSAQNIATIIGNGITRNAVIGIWNRECKRLGLPNLTPNPKRHLPRSVPRKASSAPRSSGAKALKGPPARLTKPTPPPAPPPEIKIEPLRQHLFELEDNGCRYILDEPSDATLYCGLKSTRGSFCAGHAMLSYTRGAPRKAPSEKKTQSRPRFSVFALRAI